MAEATMSYRKIRAMIVSGEIGPGERLTELGLGAQLGVSRTPVREALSQLVADGLVEPAGRGLAVAVLDHAETVAAYQVREVLEGLTAALAATQVAAGLVTPADGAMLLSLADEITALALSGDVLAATETNLEFHRLIARLSNNKIAERSLDLLWDRMRISTEASLGDAEWAKGVQEQHRRIAQSIVDGEPANARSAAGSHVVASIDDYMARLELG